MFFKNGVKNSNCSNVRLYVIYLHSKNKHHSLLSFLEKHLLHLHKKIQPIILYMYMHVLLLEVLTLTLFNSGTLSYKLGLSNSRWNKGTFSMSVKVSPAKFETCNLRGQRDKITCYF